MAAEKTIEQILSMNLGISREELLEKLKMEKKRTNGLISDETLLRIIATEFGVKFPEREAINPELSIKDLIASLNNITLVGRIVAVFPTRAFKRNRSGKVASLLVADKSGILRVVLWDSKTKLVDSGDIEAGQVIRFCHGYTREDRNGSIELHIGDKSEIKINPYDVEAKDYPTIHRFATRIVEITQIHRSKKVNVIGKVKALLSASTFTRRDSSSGNVMRLILADETGEIPVVVWNEKVNELEKMLRKGAKLQIVNAKVKKAIIGAMELQIDAETYVETVSSEELQKISHLKIGLNRVNVEGEVVTKPLFRDVKTSKGELVKLAIFDLKDETGRIWVSAWRELANLVKDFEVGDKILMKDAYVRKGFAEQLEISTRNTTTIVKSSTINPN